MIATTLTNTVYPVYTKRSYIKHNTPGKWWDSLYTWDSGFTGLGLMCCDISRAVDCLNAYLTEPNDTENAFIHHGTPLPIQFYLFQEIFNITNSVDFAKYCYPRLKQYYMFMSGQLGSSNIARLKSNLLSTWSYFYNSGGWDDYPPQVFVHSNKLENTVAPVSNTAHIIRCAKILIQIATILANYSEDISHYYNDINRLTDAIQLNTWDDKSGYFGYLCHNDQLCPTSILKYKNDENFNCGLDGTSPLIAGIVTKGQEEKILYNLMSEKHLFTKIGLSTVDMSSSYYKIDGYWNGAVWFPHQWFYFKSLLDYGYTDQAFKIAQTALNTWENEVSQSYNCYEHFIVASGRGAGWHHFSGLSTPVLLFNQSYFRAGTITCGFGGTIIEHKFSEENTSLSCTINYIDKKDKTSVIMVMDENNNYNVRINGNNVEFFQRMAGIIEITFSVERNTNINIEVKKSKITR